METKTHTTTPLLTRANKQTNVQQLFATNSFSDIFILPFLRSQIIPHFIHVFLLIVDPTSLPALPPPTTPSPEQNKNFLFFQPN